MRCNIILACVFCVIWLRQSAAAARSPCYTLARHVATLSITRCCRSRVASRAYRRPPPPDLFNEVQRVGLLLSDTTWEAQRVRFATRRYGIFQIATFAQSIIFRHEEQCLSQPLDLGGKGLCIVAHSFSFSDRACNPRTRIVCLPGPGLEAAGRGWQQQSQVPCGQSYNYRRCS